MVAGRKGEICHRDRPGYRRFAAKHVPAFKLDEGAAHPGITPGREDGLLSNYPERDIAGLCVDGAGKEQEPTPDSLISAGVV